MVLAPRTKNIPRQSLSPNVETIYDFDFPDLSTKTFKSDNEEVELIPDFQMGSCSVPHVYSEPEKWEVDFSTHLTENIPAPGIYKGEIVLYGGLYPTGSPIHDPADQLIVFSPKFGYKLIDFDDLDRMTNNYYFKYLKPLYDKKFIRCGVTSSKIRSKIFIIMGKTKFENFKPNGENNDKIKCKS